MKIINRIKSYYKKLLVYFYYTGRPIVINPIYFLRKRRNKRSLIELKSVNGGELFNYIQSVSNKSTSTGCEYSDYLTIWEDLNKKLPSTILECGSGITTVIFAYFCSIQKNPDLIKFISLEESQKYYDNILNIFPEDLKQYVEILHKERAEQYYNGILGAYYTNVPKLNFDYIFIDGPTDRAKFNDKEYPKCFNSDIINILMQSNKNICGLIDQRIFTLWALKKIIPRGSFRYDVIRKITYLNDINTSDLIQGLRIQ